MCISFAYLYEINRLIISQYWAFLHVGSSAKKEQDSFGEHCTLERYCSQTLILPCNSYTTLGKLLTHVCASISLYINFESCL